MKVLEFIVPIRIESANVMRDRHWAIRKRKTDAQHEAVYWAYREAIGPTGELFASKPFSKNRPLKITLTRIAPRALDDDNSIAGLKATRDMVAEIVGSDDGDESLTWVYKQQKGKPKEYAVQIRIEATK